MQTEIPSTGDTCISSCRGKATGFHQSCSSCSGFTACVFGYKYDMNCPNYLVWDDVAKRCEYTSSTCELLLQPQGLLGEHIGQNEDEKPNIDHTTNSVTTTDRKTTRRLKRITYSPSVTPSLISSYYPSTGTSPSGSAIGRTSFRFGIFWGLSSTIRPRYHSSMSTRIFSILTTWPTFTKRRRPTHGLIIDHHKIDPWWTTLSP